MPSAISPNMSLIEPTVGAQPSPTWAYDVNTNFSIIDSHNHSAGSGVPVTPSGMNISSDFSFLGNNATQLRSARFEAQSAVLTDPTDLICAYAVGSPGDLYWNDNNGNRIQITSSGGVVGTPGSISGLVAPAAATWVSASSTFVWTASAGVGANMDNATVILRYPGSYPAPSGNYVALQVPSGISTGYALTFPTALPVATKIMQLDSSGNISSVLGVDNSSIEINSNNLRVKANGIHGSMLNSDVADGTTIELDSSQLKIVDDVILPGVSFSSAASSGALFGGGQTFNLNNNTANSLLLGYTGSGSGYRVVSGVINSVGGVSAGEGIASSTILTTGQYRVTLAIASMGGIAIIPVVCCFNGAGFAQVNAFTTTTFDVFVYGPTGTPSNISFNFIAWLRA